MELGSTFFLLKLIFTIFMIIMIPVYWKKYGLINFLYFCDVALILTLVGIWIDNSLLISMSAVGIIAPQMLWVIDFIGKIFGLKMTGLTDYMFKSSSSKFLRGLSLFHGWLPFYLIYLVLNMGYDTRALVYWTILSWILILVSFFFLPPPKKGENKTPVNINYVWGIGDEVAQSWVSAKVWVVFMMIAMPVLFFIPTHLILIQLK